MYAQRALHLSDHLALANSAHAWSPSQVPCCQRGYCICQLRNFGPADCFGPMFLHVPLLPCQHWCFNCIQPVYRQVPICCCMIPACLPGLPHAAEYRYIVAHKRKHQALPCHGGVEWRRVLYVGCWSDPRIPCRLTYDAGCTYIFGSHVVMWHTGLP